MTYKRASRAVWHEIAQRYARQKRLLSYRQRKARDWATLYDLIHDAWYRRPFVIMVASQRKTME